MSKNNNFFKVNILYKSFEKYFRHFGWLYLIFILILAIWVNCWFSGQRIVPYALLAIVVLSFLTKPLKFIYTLVSAKISLRGFFILYIVTQLFFSLLYWSYLKDDCISIGDVAENTMATDTTADYIQITYGHVLVNTFHAGLVQDYSPLFEKMLQDEKSPQYLSIFIILDIQIFISWIFLGVLIATLYQKMRNE